MYTEAMDPVKKALNCELCACKKTILKNFKRHKQSKHETENHHQCSYCEFHHHVIGSIHIHINSKHPEHIKNNFSVIIVVEVSYSRFL